MTHRYYDMYDLDKIKENDGDTGISKEEFISRVQTMYPTWQWDDDAKFFYFKVYTPEGTYRTAYVTDHMIHRLRYLNKFFGEL